MKKIQCISAVLIMLPAIAVADVYLYTSDTTSTGDFSTGDGDDATKRSHANALCVNDTTIAPSYSNNIALISFRDDPLIDQTGYPLEPVKLPQNGNALLAADLHAWLHLTPLANVPSINPAVASVWTFSVANGSINIMDHCHITTTTLPHEISPPMPTGMTGSPLGRLQYRHLSAGAAECLNSYPVYCLGWNDRTPTPVPSTPIHW